MAKSFLIQERNWGAKPGRGTQPRGGETRGSERRNQTAGNSRRRTTLDELGDRRRHEGRGVSEMSGLPLDGNYVERHHDEKPRRDGGSHTARGTVAEHVAAHIIQGRAIEDKKRTSRGHNSRANPDFDLMGRLNQLDAEDAQVVSSIVSNRTKTNVRFY